MTQRIRTNNSMRSISKKENAFKTFDSSSFRNQDKRIKSQYSQRNVLANHSENSFIVTKRVKIHQKDTRERSSDFFDYSSYSNDDFSNF